MEERRVSKYFMQAKTKEKSKGLNGEKNKGGRPPKYASDVDLQQKIQHYFAKCKTGKEIPNKAGACVFLEIHKDTYNEYRKRFPDAIKKAELFIEQAWVQRLNNPAATGAIFYLKNAFSEDYRDRQEHEIEIKKHVISIDE